MNAVHDSYMCKCANPNPSLEAEVNGRKITGQDTGLCKTCGMIYDERLYETRLRQYIPNFTFETVDAYLREVDPRYAALPAAS